MAYMPLGASPHYLQGVDNVPEAAKRGTRGGLPTRAWLTIAACILYIASPVDLLPEALLGPFGLSDDLIAIAVLVKTGLSSRRK